MFSFNTGGPYAGLVNTTGLGPSQGSAYGLDLNTGSLPTTHTQHGSGLALANDPSPTGIANYFIGDNFGALNPKTGPFAHAMPDTYNLNKFPTLTNYLHGTYWDEGNALPGTNISNGGQLYTQLFGSPYEGQGDYSNFTADKLRSALGPQADDILRAARDWEVREVVRKKNQGFSTGGLLGAAGVSAILAPAVLAGSGLNAASLLKNPVSSVKNALAKGTTANANAVPGYATGVTTPAGGGAIVGTGQAAPLVGLQGGAPLGANALAAAGTAGVTPLAGVPDLTPYFNQTIPGTNQFLGKHVPGSDLLTKGVKKLGTELLKKGANSLAENLLAPDSSNSLLAPTSVAGGSATSLSSVVPTGNTGNPVLDRYQYALADQLTGRQDRQLSLPQYQSQKLEPGNPMRIPGYQKRPFANALAV